MEHSEIDNVDYDAQDNADPDDDLGDDYNDDDHDDDDDDDYDDGDVCQDNKGWSDKSDHKWTKRPQNTED